VAECIGLVAASKRKGKVLKEARQAYCLTQASSFNTAWMLHGHWWFDY
jgi:hypothetical protein